MRVYQRCATKRFYDEAKREAFVAAEMLHALHAVTESMEIETTLEAEVVDRADNYDS